MGLRVQHINPDTWFNAEEERFLRSDAMSWKEVLKGGDNFAREKKEGLHGWFSRRGGGGQKGWVSCQSCEDDKKGTKPCGRQDASKGTKQRCRPTCAACKTYKRRKGK